MHKNKKKILIIGSIVLAFVFIVILTFTCCFLTFQLQLKGKKKITLEVFEKYQEKGATAQVFGQPVSKIRITGKVNTNKIGTYQKSYYSTFLFFQKKKTRTIQVVDTKAPTIQLKGAEEVTIYVSSEYQDEGVEVTDNYDKNLEAKVKVTSNLEKEKVGTYQIQYEVEDSSKNKATVTRTVKVVEKPAPVVQEATAVGTYVRGILIVNKQYHLPANYNPGVSGIARQALTNLQNAAASVGHSMPLISGFRSYATQQTLYNNYVARDGEALANTYSAKPGQSEHQTGLAFDVGAIDDNYGETAAGQWLSQNAHLYGFIIRYLKGKENITGYQYEPWHIRYVGVEVATEIYQRGITLEEYLGVAP